MELIKPIITCCICLERYRNPRVLPCHHTYCAECLSGMNNSNCPECRAKFTVPEYGVEELPTCLTLQKLLQVYRDYYGIPPDPEPTIKWRPGRNGSVPTGALVGGKDINGEPLYVARAKYGRGLYPGKLACSHHGCYVSFNGEEHIVRSYEVLCHAKGYKWKKSRNGEVVSGAFEAGLSEQGEKLYVGRINHEGSLCLGRIQASRKGILIPFGCKEHFYAKTYEVLVITDLGRPKQN